jgi:hypothetical protein
MKSASTTIDNTSLPDQVYEVLAQMPKKIARQAADVRAAMMRNREILIEGQIPGGFLSRVN